MNEETLEYIRANPGCTVSQANKHLRRQKSLPDWLATEREFNELAAVGKIERREFRGIAVFYAKDE